MKVNRFFSVLFIFPAIIPLASCSSTNKYTNDSVAGEIGLVNKNKYAKQLLPIAQQHLLFYGGENELTYDTSVPQSFNGTTDTEGDALAALLGNNFADNSAWMYNYYCWEIIYDLSNAIVDKKIKSFSLNYTGSLNNSEVITDGTDAGKVKLISNGAANGEDDFSLKVNNNPVNIVTFNFDYYTPEVKNYKVNLLLGNTKYSSATFQFTEVLIAILIP